VLANLVSANHSVNQDVCQLSPFPECDGDCPDGETCVDGPDGCDCVPDIVSCEQGPFPVCLGPCPPGTACVPDDLNSECRCEPLACEQGPFPECLGPCPAGSVCGPGSGEFCQCIPVVITSGGLPNGTSIPGPLLTLKRSTTEGTSTDITLSWGASCLATDDDYEVYEGQVGSFYSHTSLFCSTGGATTITFTPSAGDRYYLVAPRNATREGSYGTDSGNTERPQGAAACLVQLIGVCP
jgi:hypothetical protein